nr:hypothetical protein [Tanacetum cinerariifolium]
MMRLINKLKKKVKKEESDEECVLKKRKKKEKKLKPKQATHEVYLSSFPTLRARTSHSSLFFAIRDSRVDMLNFLSKDGFSSLHNVSIDKIPSKLGRFVMANFNEETYMLNSDSGDKIKVTHSKIHEILCVPVGGYSLFDLERQADHEFKLTFYSKVNFLMLFSNTMGMADGLKGHICLDVVRRLCEDCVIFDIDWCGYIYHCLQFSKLPEETNHYLGPFTFLLVPVVRTRPTIRNGSSYLMKQRRDLELKDHVIGLLELHGEWTEAEEPQVEVEPLNEAKLEEVGLNCNHNTPVSFREVLSFDKAKPQPQPLPNCPPLDASLRIKRGLKPPIKPQSPDSFRIKILDNLTIHTPLSALVASFHLRDLYCYYRPCVDDPKKHYGFKPGLLGQSGSLGSLEKKRTRLRTNTKTLEDLCSQSLETVSQVIHDSITPHQKSYDNRTSVLLEDYMRKASLEYPGDGKDDDVGVDEDGNGDDHGNGDDVDGNDNEKESSVNDKEEPVEDDGGNYDGDGNGDGDDDD